MGWQLTAELFEDERVLDGVEEFGQPLGWKNKQDGQSVLRCASQKDHGMLKSWIQGVFSI